MSSPVVVRTEAVCTATVSTSPPPTGLAVTGVDPVGTAVVAVALVAVGVLLLLAQRGRLTRNRGTGVALTLVCVALTGALVTTTSPAHADLSSASGCSLISIGGIDRGATADLMPGRSPSPVLAYTVSNDAAFPIEVTVATAVARDPEHAAAAMSAQITLGTLQTGATALDRLRATQPLSIPPGGVARVEYAVALVAEAGNDLQNAVVVFDSTITAVQR